MPGVVLRKKLKSKINGDEVNIVNQVMSQHETVKDYILDRDRESIFVYQTGHTKADTFYDQELFRLIQQYDTKLRIRKTDEDTYQAQTFCHLSRHYGWVTLETSPHLSPRRFCSKTLLPH